jgi:lysozyme
VGSDLLPLVEALCLHFEGMYLRPYLCPAGIPTIGVGATFYEDGRRVTLKDPPITRERALQLLRWHITQRFLPATMRLCHGANTPGRLAALVDFAFNLGEGNLRASTLRRKVNAGAWDEVPTQFMRWNRAGGIVLPGLTRRRAAEARLI